MRHTFGLEVDAERMWEWGKEETWADKDFNKGIKSCKVMVMIFVFSTLTAVCLAQAHTNNKRCAEEAENLSADHPKQTPAHALGVPCFGHVSPTPITRLRGGPATVEWSMGLSAVPLCPFHHFHPAEPSTSHV